jgi:hypothetical protein
MRNRGRFFGIALAIASIPAIAHAGPAVALIEDIGGTSEPALSGYSEVTKGSSVNLAAGTTVKFMHYGSCTEVTVTGGKITFNRNDYAIDGGKIIAEDKQACPELVKVESTTSVAGGLVMRGVLDLTNVSAQPSLVMVGKNAAKISSVAFVDDKGEFAFELPVSDRRFSWSAGVPELSPGGNYKMILSADGKKQLEMPIRVVAASNASVVVVHVD